MAPEAARGRPALVDLAQGSEPASRSRLLKAAYAFYFLGKKGLFGIVCLVGSQKSVICGFAATRFRLDPAQPRTDFEGTSRPFSAQSGGPAEGARGWGSGLPGCGVRRAKVPGHRGGL